MSFEVAFETVFNSSQYNYVSPFNHSFWNAVKARASDFPSPGIAPVECAPYLDHINASIESTFSALLLINLLMLFFGFILVFIMCFQATNHLQRRAILRHLADTAPEHREEELRRLYKCYGVQNKDAYVLHNMQSANQSSTSLEKGVLLPLHRDSVPG